MKVVEAPAARDCTVIGEEEALQVELGEVIASLTEVMGERPVFVTVTVTVDVPPVLLWTL